MQREAMPPSKRQRAREGKPRVRQRGKRPGASHRQWVYGRTASPIQADGAWQRARCSYSSARGAAKPFAAHPFCFSPQCSLHLFPVHGIIANRTYYKWRSDREAEGARLLSEYAPKGHLGFESLLLRHDLHSPRNRGGFFACSTAGDFARASPNANAIEPRKVQRQGPILAQIDALFNRG